MTFKEALQQIKVQYLAAGLEHQQEAMWLLMHVTGKSHTDVILHPHLVLSLQEEEQLHQLLTRRMAGEPFAYLVEEAVFFDLHLKVNHHTLVPRRDTEVLCLAAEKILNALKTPQTVLDYGTGSGCIAIYLAKQCPQHQLIAIDASSDALKIAQENIQRHGVNVSCVRSVWGNALDVPIRPAMIVSNPPYLEPDDPHLVSDGVRCEPVSALVAGNGGMKDFEDIIGDAKHRLATDAWLLLEHGATQQEAVCDILIAQGFRVHDCLKDEADLPRVVVAQKA